MSVSRLALALSAFLLAAPAAAADRAQAQKLYVEALDSYLRTDFQASLTAVNKALDEDSKLVPAYALRARLWHVLGDPEEMAADCAKVLSRLRHSGAAGDTDELLAQGTARLLGGDPDEAMRSFSTALRALMKSPEAYAARARASRALGDHAQELKDLDTAIEIDPRPLYYHNRARAHFDLGHNAAAVSDLTAALKLNRNSYISYTQLGLVLTRMGDNTRALKAFNKALSLNPEYARAYIGRAFLSLARKNEEDALRDLAEAVRINPRDPLGLFNRAEVHWERGDRDAALQDYRKLLPMLRDARLSLAVADRFASQLFWREAIDACTHALELRKGSEPLVRRARAYEALRKPKAAMADLDEAVTIDPASTAAWAARGTLAFNMGQPEQALQDLGRAIKLAPADAGVRAARGSLYARTGKSSLAMEDFNQALQSDPNSAEAFNNRGALYANAFNDMDKALADIVAATVLQPKEPSYQYNLGMMRIRAKYYSKAVEAFNRALELKGPLSRILQARADAYARLGDQAEALRDIQTALEKDPRNPSIYDTLGTIRLATQDYEQAVRDLNQALRLDPFFVFALVHRGQAYGGLGQLRKAARDFKRALSIDERSPHAWTGMCTVRRLNRDAREAVEDCTKALSFDPLHGPAYLQRGLAQLALREPPRAISDLDNAFRLGTRRAAGLLAQSLAHAMDKQYIEAHRAYLAAVAQDPAARTIQAGFAAPRPEDPDYFSAVADIEALADPRLSDPRAFIVRADSLHNAGHYDKAIMEYTKTMEVDGTVAEAYLGRGDCLFAQEALDAAQQDYLRAIELDPDSVRAHLRLATLLTVRRDYKTALAHISAALKLDPRDSEAYLRAGNVYYFNGNYARALENYKLSVRYDPDSAAAHNGLGMGYFALQRYPEAVESFSRAIFLAPFLDSYQRNRASAYVNLKKFFNAAAGFRAASMVNSDPAQVGEYQRLIKDAEAQLGGAPTAAR